MVMRVDDLASRNNKGSPELIMHCDANFSPGGERSRSGVVLTINGMVIHWASNKQSITAASKCEAEAVACALGMKLGISLRALLEELTGSSPQLVMVNDNKAALIIITTQITSWRNHHYAYRAAWVRDWVHEAGVRLRHQKGDCLSE